MFVKRNFLIKFKKPNSRAGKKRSRNLALFF